MPRFCRYCGTELMEEASFCTECGKPVAKKNNPAQPQPEPVPQPAQPPAQPQPEPAQQPAQPAAEKVTEKVQDSVKQAASNAVSNAAAQAATQAKAKATQVKTQATSQAAAQVQKQVQAKVSDIASIAASTEAGEVAVGTFGDVSSVTSAAADVIRSPFMAILRGIGGFFKGIPQTFGNKKSLIFVAVLTVIYLLLFILGHFGVNVSATKVLSYLTMAEGGVNRGTVMGVAASLIGKGTVAAGLYSIFNGKIKSVWNGLKSIFGKGTYSCRSNISALLLGIGFAYLLYSFFTWKNPAALSMVGIAGILLSLETLGSREGYLYSIVQAFTSKKINKVRTEGTGQLKGLLSGISLGFVFVTAFSVLLARGRLMTKITGWGHLVLGILFVIAAVVVAICGKKKKGGAVA